MYKRKKERYPKGFEGQFWIYTFVFLLPREIWFTWPRQQMTEEPHPTIPLWSRTSFQRYSRDNDVNAPKSFKNHQIIKYKKTPLLYLSVCVPHKLSLSLFYSPLFLLSSDHCLFSSLSSSEKINKQTNPPINIFLTYILTGKWQKQLLFLSLWWLWLGFHSLFFWIVSYIKLSDAFTHWLSLSRESPYFLITLRSFPLYDFELCISV